MYTTIIHPIRLALNLSCEEYLVLDKICKLSNNIKYGGWCVVPQAKIAEWLGLPTSNVSRHIQALIEKELVLKDPNTKHLRSADLWNEIEANSHDWAIAFKGNESAFISAKIVSDKLTGVQIKSGMRIPKWDETSQNGTRNPKMGQNKVVHIDNKEETNIKAFLDFFNSLKSTKYKATSKIRSSLHARLSEGYTMEEIMSAAKKAAADPFLNGDNLNQRVYFTPEYILRPDKFQQWLNANVNAKKTSSFPILT